MAQLALDLGFAPRLGADDFLVAPSNADAHALLARWPAWPSRVAVLVGPEGSGKSHLAAIWAAISGARPIGATHLLAERLAGVTEPALVLDDADRAGVSEPGLFHLLNRVQEHRQHLLVTARTPPDRWGVVLPDLLSRLRLATLLRIEAPDEALLRAVLVKLFVDRQLTVDSGVIDYLGLHLDRSLGAARRLVDALDRASLASHRRITRAAAADMLGRDEA